MKLQSVRITNFKSINDSDVFSVDQVTCLVGKNESGKTAILHALSKLEPVVETQGNFDEVMEFPRSTYSDYSDTDRPRDVLTTRWELDDDDVAAVEAIAGSGALIGRAVTIEKGYANKLAWTIPLDYRKIVGTFVGGADLYAEELAALADVPNTTELFSRLRALSAPSERQTALLARLTAAFPEGSALATVTTLLRSRLPTFLYFGNYEAMKGEVSLQQIAAAKAQNALTMPDRIFEALLEMAGTSVDEIQKITKFEPLIAKLEAVSNRLTREIFRYWSQNKHLAIEFRFDAARPEDPAPFNTGYIFRTRIKNTRHGAGIAFDERSTGFVWFFSFLVWFSQVKEKYAGDLILLLDEPGLNLHAKAQADLLRYMKEKLAPHHQVIYTTHSPFMIDPENLMAVRTVEDVVKDDEVIGTKVSHDVLSTDRDTLFPLQTALGYEIAQTLFVGEHVLLVEGPSDLLYLRWASEQLRRRKRTTLDTRWVVTPAGSIDKISSFVALFGGKGIHAAALTDLAHGDRSKVQRLRESELLRAGHVLTVDNYAGQPEADIEDLLGRPAYVSLVNRCYSLPKKQAIAERRPSDAPSYFRKLWMARVEGMKKAAYPFV
jgi:predicted ATPase